MPEKVSESQVIFERAVHHHVSSALFSQLERIDEFQIGAVLVNHEKPHFWRKKELDFSSLPFQKLLLAEDASNLSEVQTQTKVLFTDTDDHSTKQVDINLDLDGEVKVAFIKLGGDLGGDAKKTVTIDVSLGSLKHITSNMYDTLTGSQLRVDPEHPVVKDAMAKGKAFFVINSIYQSDKAEIKVAEKVDVSVTDKDNEEVDGTNGATPKDSTADGATPKDSTADGAKPKDTETTPTSQEEPGATTTDGAVGDAVKDAEKVITKNVSGDGKESAQVSSGATGLIVTNRSIPTNIAFQVMKVEIGKQGVLVPQGRSGFDHPVKIHFPYGDTFAQVTPGTPPSNGGATGEATPTNNTTPEHTEAKNQSDQPKGDETKKDEPSADDKSPKNGTPDDSKDKKPQDKDAESAPEQ